MTITPIQWVRHRSVGTKLLILILPILVAFLVMFGWYFAWHRDMARVEESVTQQAGMIAVQLTADREYYTRVVVPRITQLGGQLVVDYHQLPEGAPLPATFVREVSQMTRTGQAHYSVELISPWPINKSQGVRDPFQQAAFDYLARHRDGIYSRIDVVDGKRTLRYVKADLASATACVACHNAHPDSPRHDYKLNDLMGGLEVRIPVEAWLVKVRRDEGMVLLWGAGICTILVGVIWYGVHRIVTKPLGILTRLMKKSLATTVDPAPSHTQTGAWAEPHDEVKALWRAFADMEQIIKRQHGELRWSNQRLKEQVVERTAQLQNTVHTWLRVTDGSLAFIETAPLPIMMTYADGRVAVANTAAWQGFGYAEDSAVLGKPVTMLIAEPDWQRAVALLRQAAAGREEGATEPVSMQLQGLRKNGKRFVLDLTLSVIERDGELYYVLTTPDLSETRPAN